MLAEGLVKIKGGLPNSKIHIRSKLKNLIKKKIPHRCAQQSGFHFILHVVKLTTKNSQHRPQKKCLMT